MWAILKLFDFFFDLGSLFKVTQNKNKILQNYEKHSKKFISKSKIFQTTQKTREILHEVGLLNFVLYQE